MSSEIEDFEEFLNGLTFTVDSVKNSIFYSPDWDEVFMRTEHLTSILPKRFIEVVKSKNTSPSIDTRDRLLRILKVDKKLKLSPSLSDNIDAVTPMLQLTKPDKIELSELVSQIRNAVYDSVWSDEKRKAAVLRKVNDLQAEIDKFESDSARLLGITDQILDRAERAFEIISKPIKAIKEIANKLSRQQEALPAPDEIKAIEDKSGEL